MADIDRAEKQARRQLADAIRGMESAKALGVKSAFDAHKSDALEANDKLFKIAAARAVGLTTA